VRQLKRVTVPQKLAKIPKEKKRRRRRELTDSNVLIHPKLRWPTGWPIIRTMLKEVNPGEPKPNKTLG